MLSLCLERNEPQKCCTADRIGIFVKRPSYYYAVFGLPGTIFDAQNRGNLLPNDSHALNRKDTLHPARVIYDIVVRYIQPAGLEFCEATYTNYQFFPALNIPGLI